MRLWALTTMTALALGQSAGAEPLLTLPIDCTLGRDCHIQQFVDRDPTPGAADFRCGTLSYDGHEGTDFALPTLADLTRDVAVLAAADGRVLAVRDGMDDRLQIGPDAPDVTGRECGNGVVIDHGDGWQTQYCHLARGSIRVSRGQEVSAGEPIGTVGLSGQTQFPHLHLTVRHDGVIVDPFAPEDRATCGPALRDTLWLTEPAYRPGGLIDAGFSTSVPDYDAVKAGLPPGRLTPDQPMVLWGFAFGAQAGDVLRIMAEGPNGPAFARDVPLDRTQARLFSAFGRHAPAGGWTAGVYRGTLTLIRNGTVIDATEVTATVD